MAGAGSNARQLKRVKPQRIKIDACQETSRRGALPGPHHEPPPRHHKTGEKNNFLRRARSARLGTVDTGTRCAVNIAKITGAFAWGVGLLLHIQLITSLTSLLEALIRGWGLGIMFSSWQMILLDVLLILSGPVAVAVGGGLRYFGGVLAGEKLGGEHAARIAGFEWLRYELMALGIALMFGSLSALAGFTPTGTPWDLGLIICLFLGYVVMGLVAAHSALRCGKKSAELMWMIRREGLQRGMVPYPAGVAPSKNPYESGIWKSKSETGRPVE